MSPIGSSKPEAACLCGQRTPLITPPTGRINCPECGGEMIVVGSDHDFTKGERK